MVFNFKHGLENELFPLNLKDNLSFGLKLDFGFIIIHTLYWSMTAKGWIKIQYTM